MSTSQILQHLYSLDASSPDISRLVYSLIRRDEEERYLSSLKGLELARLVNFLDDVCTILSAFSLVTNRPCRLSVQFPPPTTFSADVYANCKPSVATT